MEENMKKFLIILLAVLICISACILLAACDNEETPSPAPSETDAETTIEAHIHSLVKVAAIAPTCYDKGNIECYYCSCGKYFKDANATTELETNGWVLEATGHSMTKVEATEPTCGKEGNVEYYACANCGDNFRDEQGESKFPHNGWIIYTLDHAPTKVLGTAATCTEAGNIEHYICDCGRHFADAYGLEQINENSWVIQATGHTLDPETGHCSSCDAEME